MLNDPVRHRHRESNSFQIRDRSFEFCAPHRVSRSSARVIIVEECASGNCDLSFSAFFSLMMCINRSIKKIREWGVMSLFESREVKLKFDEKTARLTTR